jgi:hypothetical protein
MYKNLKSFFNSNCLFFKIIFNRPILNKVIFIFTIGLISRAFINVIYNVNIFSGYLNQVHVIYYLFFSFLIIIIHEFVDYFHINIFPFVIFLNVIDNIIINIVGFITRILISMNKRIFFYRLEDIKVSSIPSVKKGFINRNKVVMHINEPNASNTSNGESNNSDDDSDATISDTEENRLRAVEKDKREEAERIHRAKEEAIIKRREQTRRYMRERSSRK